LRRIWIYPAATPGGGVGVIHRERLAAQSGGPSHGTKRAATRVSFTRCTRSRSTTQAAYFFDQDGKILTTPWMQFGKPSGIFFDTKGQIYIADSESDDVQNPVGKRGSVLATRRPAGSTAASPNPSG
jgi:hypothetical protein